MSWMNDSNIDDTSVIYIDGTIEELVPGFNDIMARMAELYIENYLDPDYLDGLDDNESILIDYTALSEEEMHELTMCAITSLELDANDNWSGLYLS